MQTSFVIDTAVFTTAKNLLEGSLDVSALDARVREVLGGGSIHYRIRGGVDQLKRPFLDLSLSGEVQMPCRYCLEDAPVALNDAAHILLLPNEQVLDEVLFADVEADGILWEAHLNMLPLIEDQILMALPPAPAHEACAQNSVQTPSEKPNPFAVLQGLKKS